MSELETYNRWPLSEYALEAFKTYKANIDNPQYDENGKPIFTEYERIFHSPSEFEGTDQTFTEDAWKEANLISSETLAPAPDLQRSTEDRIVLFDKNHPDGEERFLHMPIIDCDFPVLAIPSSSQDHFHLYLLQLMPWEDYRKLLDVMLEINMIQQVWYDNAMAHGRTYVRMPNCQKPGFKEWYPGNKDAEKGKLTIEELTQQNAELTLANAELEAIVQRQSDEIEELLEEIRGE